MRSDNSVTRLGVLTAADTYDVLSLNCSECGHLQIPCLLTSYMHSSISAMPGNNAGNYFPKISSVLFVPLFWMSFQTNFFNEIFCFGDMRRLRGTKSGEFSRCSKMNLIKKKLLYWKFCIGIAHCCYTSSTGLAKDSVYLAFTFFLSQIFWTYNGRLGILCTNYTERQSVTPVFIVYPFPPLRKKSWVLSAVLLKSPSRFVYLHHHVYTNKTLH